MRSVVRSVLALVFVVAVAGCSDLPTGAQDEASEPVFSSHSSSPVVASASGGANWTLEVFGFSVPQVLGFQARKFPDGRVRGHIEYHQVFQGERFTANATVTCLEVYDGGTRAKYGGRIVESSDPSMVGTFIWFQSIDNGEGAAAPADESTGSGFGTEEENEAFCASDAPPNPIFVAEVDGNIQVSEG